MHPQILMRSLIIHALLIAADQTRLFHVAYIRLAMGFLFLETDILVVVYEDYLKFVCRSEGGKHIVFLGLQDEQGFCDVERNHVPKDHEFIRIQFLHF